MQLGEPYEHEKFPLDLHHLLQAFMGRARNNAGREAYIESDLTNRVHEWLANLGATAGYQQPAVAGSLDDPTPNLVALSELAGRGRMDAAGRDVSGTVFVNWLRAVCFAEEAIQTMQHQTTTFQRGVAFESGGTFVDFDGQENAMTGIPQPQGAKSAIIANDEVFFQPAGGRDHEIKGQWVGSTSRILLRVPASSTNHLYYVETYAYI